MSVYTPVSAAELDAFLTRYTVGTRLDFSGIEGGIENSNFFVTTTGGAFVLTLFEQHTPQALDYFLKLMDCLAGAGIPVAKPVATRDGELLSHLNGKPAALLTRLPGSHPEHTTTDQCSQIGAMLARMHLAGKDFPLYRAPDRGHAWRMQTTQDILPYLNAPDVPLLRTEMQFQTSIPFAELPTGTIHADLFRDNVLFHNGQLSGILDLYFACTDSLLYDLAVVVNDWCCNPDGSLDEPRLQACLQAYQAIRPWQPVEQEYWPAVLRAAALRFWLSRLVVKLNPPQGELTLQKDPQEFRNKLLQRIAATDRKPTMQAITLDARRLLCPMPVIRVQQAIEDLPDGVTLTAICTDPGALHDIPAWARIHGHTVLETRSEGREHIIVLQTGQA
jgi:homoserine kinase type II